METIDNETLLKEETNTAQVEAIMASESPEMNYTKSVARLSTHCQAMVYELDFM